MRLPLSPTSSTTLDRGRLDRAPDDIVQRNIDEEVERPVSVDVVSPRVHLQALTRGALHCALLVVRNAGSSNREVRELLARACDTARENGLRAEHLLLVLKESWRELPEMRCLNRSEAEDALSRTITLCIEEYYTIIAPPLTAAPPASERLRSP
jgi:hypothetical protein